MPVPCYSAWGAAGLIAGTWTRSVALRKMIRADTDFDRLRSLLAKLRFGVDQAAEMGWVRSERTVEYDAAVATWGQVVRELDLLGLPLRDDLHRPDLEVSTRHWWQVYRGAANEAERITEKAASRARR